jgi:hypothetical protein
LLRSGVGKPVQIVDGSPPANVHLTDYLPSELPGLL